MSLFENSEQRLESFCMVPSYQELLFIVYDIVNGSCDLGIRGIDIVLNEQP